MMDKPLRFCMITTFYPPYNFGGDGIFVHRLSNELARRGHQVEVIHCIDAYRLLARREPTGTYDDHPNVTVHGLKSPFGFLSPLATQQTGFPFFKSARIQQILEKGFDVIHYHNISLVGGPKVLEYGKGIKLYTMHEYWLVCPTHVLFRFNRAACTQPHCFLCSLIYKRPPQWWRYLGLLEAAVKHVNVFIAPSRFGKDIHHQLGLNVPIVHLPYFIPAPEATWPASERVVGEAPQKPYFLFVGRLERLKGLQTLIPIFRDYHKAELLVVGTGSFETRLRRLAEGSANIRFLGYQSGGQLQALYQQAAAIIVPSVCFDVFPQVMIEAFRQQTPAIVRNLGGMPEIIEESGGGFVYDTQEELVAAMDQLLANPSHRDEMGLRGHQAYQRQWTPEAHLKRYFALIQEIATASANRPSSEELPLAGRIEASSTND
jgi:glycosyltransferase involved in cell wall biosynthesis